MIPHAQPDDMGEEDIQLVNEVYRPGRISMGRKCGEFEEICADYIGTKHAIALNNWTSRLYLCMKAISFMF